MTPGIERLIQAFRALPGVGRKTATKYVYALLQAGSEASDELEQALAQLRQATRTCQVCFNWAETNPCDICQNRSARQICVVETPGDIVAVEKSGMFRGQYHVLRGLLDPLNNVNVDDLTVDALVARVNNASCDELILALSPTREGEATCRLIATMLAPQALKITRLAHGVPLGGQLEYVDEGTLSLAMEHRRSYP